MGGIRPCSTFDSLYHCCNIIVKALKGYKMHANMNYRKKMG